jgi:ubiquinone/menaquinone biosynthesis C-methylase UbiE
MGLTPQEWHQRFNIQAGWTKNLRSYLLTKAGIQAAKNVLDVGCGTGALENDTGALFEGHLFGIDFNLKFLSTAKSWEDHQAKKAFYSQANATHLPYPEGCFDLSFCHFLLLWLDDPSDALKEMVRVTRAGGKVLALAEPDYGGRIDFPTQFVKLGQMQMDALLRQGAHPRIGRELAALFHRAGLKQVETGILGAFWSEEFDEDGFISEWEMLEYDLSGRLSKAEMEDLRDKDRITRSFGNRILYVPTFFASGTVPA